MAPKDGSGYYTKFTFVENEQVLVRRIHRLEIQAWDGRLYAVEGKQLPDYIGGTSGAGVKNERCTSTESTGKRPSSWSLSYSIGRPLWRGSQNPTCQHYASRTAMGNRSTNC